MADYYACYRLDTGRIGSVLRMSESDIERNFDSAKFGILNIGSHEDRIDTRKVAEEFYVVSGELQPLTLLPRPTKTEISADGLDVAVWSDLPIGTRVIVRNSEYGVTDETGLLEFSTEYPGDFTVILYPPLPYASSKVRIKANAP